VVVGRRFQYGTDVMTHGFLRTRARGGPFGPRPDGRGTERRSITGGTASGAWPRPRIVQATLPESDARRLHAADAVMLAIMCRSRYAFAVLSMVVMLAACRENMHARYANLTELQRAGSGARSWFLASLPASAVDLEEWHNLDTNETVGRFRMSGNELASFRAAVIAQSIGGEMKGARLAMRDVDDWPSCLTGKVTESDLRKCGFEAYRLRDFEIVIDPKTYTVYFWTA
jgi:hypothetical protein